MNPYETSATVEAHGQVRAEGVPFAPGTRVEVTITPIPNGSQSPTSAGSARAERLLAALDKARNTETVGPLSRAELHDRNVLH
jgi:hypothetical protein